MSISNEQSSIFTKIIARQIPADIVYEDDDMICIKDIRPQADVHLLCITKIQYQDYSHFIDSASDQLILKFFKTMREIATEHTDAYRIVTNNGKDAGQEIMHLHFHILGYKA